MKSLFRVLVVVLYMANHLQSHELNGRQIKVHTGLVNWFQASEICLRHGMQLLTINSPKENMEAILTGDDCAMESMWIAATDLAQNGQWTWSASGSEVKDPYWQEGELQDVEENCVELIVVMEDHPTNWKSTDCYDTRAFICEEVVKKDPMEEWDEEGGGIIAWFRKIGK